MISLSNELCFKCKSWDSFGICKVSHWTKYWLQVLNMLIKKTTPTQEQSKLQLQFNDLLGGVCVERADGLLWHS